MKLSMKLLFFFPDIDYDFHRLAQNPQYRVRALCRECDNLVWRARLKIFQPWKYLEGERRARAIRDYELWTEYHGPEFCKDEEYYCTLVFCPECWEIFWMNTQYEVDYGRDTREMDDIIDKHKKPE